MKKFSNVDGILIVKNMIQTIQLNKEHLSEIDGQAGDGDHGINMNKGFSLAEEELKEGMGMSEGFSLIAKNLMMKIGGSMGPLYGNFFRGLQMESQNHEMINAQIIYQMLEKAYKNISSISTAKLDDKTLIDVLDPAINAYKEELQKSNDFVESLKKMMEVGDEQVVATKSMIAKVGRASRLGERSIGFQDAGATSCNLLLQAFAQSIIELLGEDE